MNEQRSIKPIECDRNRAGIEFRNESQGLVLFNLLADRIVKFSQKSSPCMLKPFVSGGCFRHGPHDRTMFVTDLHQSGPRFLS